MSGKHVASLGEGDSFITQEAIDGMTSNGWIPLYLEGRTVIGKANIKGNMMEVEIDDEAARELFDYNLIGLSIVHRAAQPEPFTEEVTIKEKTDEQ